ncbi:MAG: ATP-binding protein, partial [Pirellulaceae bacterium]
MPDFDLSELLKRMEGETIDFKADIYSFDGDDKEQKNKKRAQFIKDIVSMYNTPRDEPAYIVLGVKESEDGKREILGVSRHLDLADLDAQIAGHVHPVPRIEYEPILLDSMGLAVIVIRPQPSIGPVFPISSLGNTLMRHQLYLRRNTNNVEANPDEMRRVYSWFSGETLAAPPVHADSGNWTVLMGSLSSLSASHYNVLIVDVPAMPSDQAANWAAIDWAFVADMDASTDVSGLLSRCKSGLEHRRQVHLLVKGDRGTLIPERSTYWYCARGYEGRQSTMPKSDKWMDWNRAYGNDFREKVASFAAAAGDRPINLLCAWYADRDTHFLSSMLDAFQSELGERLNIAIVSDSISSELSRIADGNEAKAVEIPLSQLSLGLNSMSAPNRSVAGDSVQLPTSSGAPFEVSEQKLHWISEEADLVSESIGNTPELRSPRIGFLRGNEISWYELGLNCDVPRGISSKLDAAIRRGIESRKAIRVNLFHQPGAGGTTVSRRLLWLFHDSHPTILLRAYSNDTIARLEYISHMTKLPIILGVDAGSITDRQADQLFEQLRARNVAAVMFQTLRRSSPPKSMERSFFLESKLDKDDLDKFVFYLSREAPSRQHELERLRAETQSNLQSPFYLALLTFGRDFVRLSDYVAERVVGLSESQQTCIAFLSMSHLFGQRAIPEQMFAELFGLPQSKRVDLSRAFNGHSAIELLSHNGKGDWRTSHILIADEYLTQVLGQSFDDKRAWKQQLSKVSKEFIDFCRGPSTGPTSDSMDIVQRVFVFRGNS